MVAPLRSLLPALVLGARLVASPPSLGAATVAAPTITITGLDHMPGSCCGYQVDYAAFPGTGYTGGSYTGGGGFTATIATGDVISIRIEAPAGKKFSLRPPPGATFLEFSFDVYWLSSGGTGIVQPNTVTFEGLVGPAPTETYSYASVTSGRTSFEAWKQYRATASFEFRAVEVRITSADPQPTTTRNYSGMSTHQGASFEADAIPDDPAFKIMQIVDEAVTPSRATTWGRIHELYR